RYRVPHIQRHKVHLRVITTVYFFRLIEAQRSRRNLFPWRGLFDIAIELRMTPLPFHRPLYIAAKLPVYPRGRLVILPFVEQRLISGRAIFFGIEIDQPRPELSRKFDCAAVVARAAFFGLLLSPDG